MDKNSEPEEGEAFYDRDDNDDINPDTAFSYLDEKIKNILGHFQKDFEGGVSAENLGAKFGGYGSFLPTYERSPSRLSQPKTPQRNSSTPRSTNNLTREGASQNLKAPPNAPPTGRPGNASCPTGSIAVKYNSHLSSAQVAEKSVLKDDRAGIPSDQKTLKVRIKVGSDDKVQKNAAIYSGLGLDDSPSSSLGNSPEESGETVTLSQGTTNESPMKILQVMTSYHVPGGVLISPLHESLLCLLRKEKERPSRDRKSIPLLKACQENSSGLIDESVLDNGKQLNEKKTKSLIGKSKKLVESKHRNRINVENGKMLLIKKESENEIAGGKELLSNDLKHIVPSNSVNVADSMEATLRAHNLSADANEDGSRGGLFSSDSAKEDSLESISGRSRTSGKKKKQDIQSGSVEKVWEQSVVNSHKNASLDLGDNVGSKCYQNSAPLKCKEESKTKGCQIATSHVQNKINIPPKMEDTFFVGKKKSKGSKNTGQIADSMKESLRLDACGTPKDTTSSSQSFSSGKSKMHKLKLQKDINKVRDNHRDASDTNFKQKRDQLDPSMRAFLNRPKDSGPMDFEREQNVYLDKSKEIFSSRTVDNQLLGVDAPGVVPHLTDKTLVSQTTALAATIPVVIQENWVQCDHCHKWRLLPFDTRPEQLPEKWLCSMLNWLPGMNRCDISEEETTKALNALYQVPVADNQNNPQNHANGTTSLVPSAHPQHLDQKKSSLNSQVSSIRGKKKYGPKEVHKAGSSGLSQISKSIKNQQQESLKNRSLNNMTKVPNESNLAKKSSFQRKEKYPVAGVTKQAKMNTKRESDLYTYEGSKKPKTEVVYATDKHHSSNLDIRRLGLNSSTGLPTQANGRSMQNHDECSISGDIKHDLKERSIVSVKKLVDQTQASSDGVSLDMRVCDKRASVKKRKLEDWKDSQNGQKLYMKEESSESGFRNEKKSRDSKIEGKRSHRNGGDGTSNMKSMDHLIDGNDEVRSIDRHQHLGKHKKKSSSQKSLDGLDSLRRDTGTGQISKVATSSSSKVSDSRKTRVNFEEARGSPVESVSSSPMRTSYPQKLASIKGDGSGKDDAANSGIPPSGNFERFWDGEGTAELAQSVSEMKEKVSGDFNPKSHKSSTLDFRDRDSIRKISIKTKPSSRLWNDHLLNGDTFFAENGQHALERPHGEDRVNKECQGNVFSQKSDKVYTSPTKDSERSAADKTKAYEPMDEQEDLCSRKSMRYQSDVGPKGHAHLQETISDCKLQLPKSSKDDKNPVGSRDPSGHWSINSRMEAQSNKRHDEFHAKSAAACSTKGKTPEKKLIQDFGGQTKVMRVETRSGMSKTSLHCEVESQQEIIGDLTEPEAQRGVVSDGFPVNGSGNGDVSRAIKQPGKASSNNGSNHSLGKHLPDLRLVRDFNAHSPVRVNSSSQRANDALNDAKKLRNYADRLKGSGFVFESNEIYFKAALKFLGVAAFLETSNSESARHGDMNQVQVYSTATKLCEMCAQEYERRREMAAAALAYKCMEVAYMRVVYCKHSTSSRDRSELQATVQMVPQGESPSSSASDVDNNLNNQQTVEKAPLAKGNVSHVGGTHLIVARNRPSFVRLLDFTQDVSFAMEASRKTQNAFAAANSALEETQNTEFIISVRKVIDFSFQDVDGLVCLVQQAMEAISRSGLGGARD